MEGKTCVNCGDQFSIEHVRSDARYCSDRCKDAHNNNIKSIRRKERLIMRRIGELKTMLADEKNPELIHELKIAIMNIQTKVMPHWTESKRFQQSSADELL